MNLPLFATAQLSLKLCKSANSPDFPQEQIAAHATTIGAWLLAAQAAVPSKRPFLICACHCGLPRVFGFHKLHLCIARAPNTLGFDEMR
jgi:hypothetical protein